MKYRRITPETTININDEIIDDRFPWENMVVYNYLPDLNIYQLRLKSSGYDEIAIKHENMVSGNYLKMEKDKSDQE